MKKFKLVVAGGRDFNDKARCRAEMYALAEELGASVEVSIVSGMARGADRLAWEICKEDGIEVHEYFADWDTFGKSAGYRRNDQMAQVGTGLLVFWDGHSRGTEHMIKTMQKLGKPVRVVPY